ncbi:hypothetical protein N2152v2_009083 [Parachlorella kessleri]
MDFQDYDPKHKAKDPRRTKKARRQLAMVVGALAVLGVVLYTSLHVKQAGPGPPSDSTKAGKQQLEQQQQEALHRPLVPSSRLGGARLHAISERMAALSPQYRGVGKVETLPAFANANRLLLATNGRLLWYRYDTDELRVIQEGQGVYYGAFTGEARDALGAPIDLWVVLRPQNWQQHSGSEALLHLALETGEELGRMDLPTRFAHDAVRRRGKVYVSSTAAGRILEYDFPSFKLEREIALFSEEDHINTLAPTADGKLWVVLYGPASSSLAEVELGGAEGPRVVRRVENVGRKAHGLVFWDRYALVLDSAEAALLAVDVGAGTAAPIWQLNDTRWSLKGLAVVDDIAFFGATPQASAHAPPAPAASSVLAAFDLKARVLLWWRRLPTQGPINVVAAPHLAVESTAYSLNTVPLVNYKTRPEWETILARAQAAPAAAFDGTREGTHPALVKPKADGGASEQQRHGRQQERILLEVDGSLMPGEGLPGGSGRAAEERRKGSAEVRT